jgi:hypothetical protein
MASLRRLVSDRARGRCEYCRMPQSGTSLPHEIDHIRAKKHRGLNTLANSAWACAQCNRAKGTDATGFDPASDDLVPLFNPRADIWSEHFTWNGPVLVGVTATGRATVELLKINRADRVEHRRLLLQRGVFEI